MLIEQLNEDMKAAMKNGDKSRLSTIRMLRAAIKDKEIEIGHALSDQEIIAVIGRLVKQRQDAASQYAKAGREDLQKKEMAEAEILGNYLPEALGEEELIRLIDAIIAKTGAVGMRDMGKVMAAIKAEAEGRADMGKVSMLVKQRLG